MSLKYSLWRGMDIFSWPPISWAFISFLANPSPLLPLPSCILFLTSGLYTSVWRDGCFSHLCKSEFVCLETINHDWQPCFVGCQILLTVSDSWKFKVLLKIPTYISDAPYRWYTSSRSIYRAALICLSRLRVYLPQPKISHQQTLYIFGSEKAIPFYLPWIWKYTKLLEQKDKNNNEADTSGINQYSTIDVNRAMQIHTS